MSNILKDGKIPIKIARISTIPFFVETQLKTQIIDIRNAGYDVTIICSKDDKLESYLRENKIGYININISRNISIFSDLLSLLKLYKAFKVNAFDIVHSTTPKAGLLVSIAGLLANAPIRLHTFTGQVWVNLKGAKKYILKFADKVIIKLNTNCYADGFSQISVLKKEGVIKFENKIKVLGKGSLSGVDLSRFDLQAWNYRKNDLLKEYGINKSSKKIIFIGRLSFDKGIEDLINAFLILLERKKNYSLILVGPIENDSNLISKDIMDQIKNSKKIYHFGFNPCPEIFYTVGDIFCLPSYREGFGTSVIEAAAMGLPTIGTNVVGLVDSIVDNVTGVLVPVNDSLFLANAIEELLDDNNKRKNMSNSASKRAKKYFDSSTVNNYVIDEYRRLVDNTFYFIKG